MIFDKNVLFEFLIRLDSELKVEAKIYIIGGSAATIAYESKDGTRDIDTWEYEKRIAQAYERLMKKDKDLCIPLRPVYVQIKSEEMKSRFLEFKELILNNLRIFVPEPEDLFLLKAQRGSEKDLDDLASLHKKKNLNSDLLIRRFKDELLPQNPGSDDMLVMSYLHCIAFIFGQDTCDQHEINIKS